MAWSPPEDSPAAALDENEYLARVAADLAACEPLPMKPTPAPQYVTQRELDLELSKLCEGLGKMVKQELDRRQAELEAKQLKLGGVWRAGEHYAENTLVTHAGGLWISRAPTEARPGSGSPSWRLAVKSGDAK